MTKQEILDRFKDINEAYNDSSRYDSLSRMLDELLEEQEQKLDSIVCFENGDKVRLWNCPLCKSEVRIVLKGR